ncbi:MAG: hypothetical protein ACRD1K_19370 [Acidimicrobiales bacterium]
MSTIVMAALGGLIGVGAFLVLAGLTGRTVFAGGGNDGTRPMGG